jgi:hypothetical protein
VTVIKHIESVFEGMPCYFVKPAPDMFKLVEAPVVARVLISIPCCNSHCFLEPGGAQMVHHCPKDTYAVFRQKYYPENGR